MTDEEAAAAARAIPNVENLTTKQDLAELKSDIAVLKFAVFGVLIPLQLGVLGLLIKLAFFPT